MPVASTNLTGFVAFFEFGRWEIAEGYVDVFFADDDLFGDAFDDSALFGWGEGGPAFVEVGCFCGYFIGGKLVHFQGVEFPLQFAQFGSEGAFLVFQGTIELAETFRGDLVTLVELVDLAHFRADLFEGARMGRQTLPLLGEVLVSPGEMFPDLLFGDEEVLRLVAQDEHGVRSQSAGP